MDDAKPWNVIRYSTAIAWLTAFLGVAAYSAIRTFALSMYDPEFTAALTFGVQLIVGAFLASSIALGTWLAMRLSPRVIKRHKHRLVVCIALGAAVALLFTWPLDAVLLRRHGCLGSPVGLADYVAALLGLVVLTLAGQGLLLHVLFRWDYLHAATPGSCAACGYPIGTSATCTECGGKLNLTPAKTR